VPGEQRPPIERAVSALRRAAGELVRSRPGRWLADAVAPLYRGASVRELPAWFGALNGIRVPRSVRPAPTATAASSANINIILDLLDETAGVPGQVAECGVFRGATLVAAALHLERAGIEKRVFGFDSFDGLGEEVAVDVAMGGDDDPHKHAKGFADTSPTEVIEKARRLGVAERITLWPGRFEDSLVRVAGERFSFVHLDCDLFESYRTCLAFFYARLEPGGVLLLDEYDDPPWPGCNRAVDDFMADKPESLVAVERDRHVKHYFRKR
jgi:hypothetical protein